MKRGAQTIRSLEDYKLFIASKSNGLTKTGQLLFQQSIESFVYCVLGSQANTRWPIVGKGAMSLQTQEVFKKLENLNWPDYLNDVSRKIDQRIRLLRRVKAFPSVKDRLTIYNSLILPLFDYADIIWCDKNNSTLMDQLYRSFRTRLQRQFLTLLCYPPPLKLSQSCTGTHLPTCRRFLHRMVTIFKLKYNLIDSDFDLPKINCLHNRRQRDHIHLSKPNTNWGKQRLLNIKSIKQLNSFYNALLKSPKY